MFIKKIRVLSTKNAGDVMIDTAMQRGIRKQRLFNRSNRVN